MPTAPKDVLTSYLQGARDSILWKLEGLYFGQCFGRAWPTPDELVPDHWADPQADWYASADEPAAGIVDLQRHAGHADIVREQIDGSVGLLRDSSNLPGDADWPSYVARLTEIADRF